MAVDVLVRGATVYDGTGAPGQQMDVAMAQGRIVAVGERAGEGAAARVVDAGGLALAPGFIDLHSHADFTLPAFPDAPNSITQGVTTEVLGHCGFSPAPVSPDPGLADQLRTYARGIGPDLDWGWHSFGEFLDRLQEVRPVVNVVPLVGHGPLRIAAMGMDDRRPTATELAAMRAGLADALAAGAWGMSTGLVYPPGVFADRDELLEIGQELERAEALYDSHVRNEGDGLLAAVDEALAIGEQLGIRVQISHLKATGRRNFGRVGDAIERIEGTRARGVRAHCDVYPYTAGSTFLHQVLPPWVKDGGTERMLERLRAEEHRRRIRRELETGLPDWGNHLEAAGGWQNILIASVVNPELRWAEGRRVAELAAQSGADPLDFTLDLLIRDRGATIMVIFSMDEADVRAALCYREAGIGSDQLGVTSAEARVHPRAYGTFARVLGWAARDTGLLPLEEAVRKMTGLPAEILGLADRGRVAPGAVADLVLFDPATIQDAATYEQPTRRARGVEYVLVAGDFAIERGEPRQRRCGRVLRRASRAAARR